MLTSVTGNFIKLTLLFAIVINSCKTITPTNNLKEGFINPPDSSRPGVYWYFMDGNISRDAMTDDLESMKEAGLGYALFLEVNVGVPRGKIDFLSEEWQELFRHAVSEAERLGIRIILGSGPGWAGSGGPWVTPAQSMMHLVASDTTVSGPVEFDGILAVPEPMRPYFGENSLSDILKEQRNKWYKDVVVLAFPAPQKESNRIDRIDEKALYYRAPFTSRPNILPYIPFPSNFNETPHSSIDPADIINITDKIDETGRLKWEVPSGRWTILRFGMRNNGAVTRPAPLPGLGFEADKFDTTSFIAHYDSYVGKLIKKVNPRKTKTGGGLTMIHIDSWEMGSQNWSPYFREEFSKKRGYDLLNYLPVYTGRVVGSNEISERFLWDLRETSNELIMENHAGFFKQLGRRNGLRLSIEPYDMNPAADFDLGSVADVPMCEFWSDGFGYNSAYSCIEATSIAHVTGVPVVAAESFTADHTEAWKKYPGDMKNQGDWAFCIGINRLIYHTFAHKPFSDKLRPGMTMGPYGVHWDRGQTWWPMVKGYHKYISRCQYLLSQGNTVSDILYLTPEGAPQVFLPPVSSLEGTSVLPDKKGYSFDGCSPLYLIKYASVKDNKIIFPGGASYRIMVLPDIISMTPELISKIGTLIMEGATVLGNPPERSPSLSDYPACDKKVKDLAFEIWGEKRIPAEVVHRKYGLGKIISGDSIYIHKVTGTKLNDTLALYPDYEITADLLKKSGVLPDFHASGNIRYTHRSVNDLNLYFISNRTGMIVQDTCKFRDGTDYAEIWDPVTGDIYSNAEIINSHGYKNIPIRLNPFQSCFIVFSKPDKPANVSSSGENPFKEKTVVKILDGSWNVSFDTVWGGPSEIIFDQLTDWTQRKEDGIRFYSGIASYSKEFDFPEYSSVQNSENYLDLGRVKNIARVRLNGFDLGIVWTEPFQVNTMNALKKNKNRLEIEVSNLWVNRLIGDETHVWNGVENGKWPEWLISGKPKPTGRFTFTTHHYYRKGDPLTESGLIGPVRIMKTPER
jgi:hypothetical protein